jgi:hypothetical protein
MVEQMVHDPDLIPTNTIALVGYYGKSNREGFRRIYLDLTFRAYYEVEEKHVHHVQAADPANKEAPTKIIIDAEAKLTLVQTLEASFLQGAIASAFSAGSALTTDLPQPAGMEKMCNVAGPHGKITYGDPTWCEIPPTCFLVHKQSTAWKLTYGYTAWGVGPSPCAAVHQQNTAYKITYGDPDQCEGPPQCAVVHKASTACKITWGI